MVKKNLLIPIIFLSHISCNFIQKSESNKVKGSDSTILTALKERNDLAFNNKTRDLLTVVEDSSKFDYIFPNTDISCGYIIRYFFHTNIHLSKDLNELFSMNGNVFNVEVFDNIDQEEYIINLTENVLILISNMYYGSSELQDFLYVYPNVIIPS